MGMMAQRSDSDFAKRLTIGVFLGDVNTYTDLIWSGIAEKAKEQNINTLAFVGRGLTNDPEDKTTSNIIYQLANEHNLDGLIILTAGIGASASHQGLTDFCHLFSPLPVVSIGEKIEGISNVLVDNQKGLRDLILHLIDEHGSQQIAFVKGPENNTEAQERFQAYQQALADRDIPLDETLIVPGGFTYEQGQAATEELFRRGIGFDAISSIDDKSAWGVINTLHAHGIHVPNDVAVTGFDDIVGSQYTMPPLSTVRQPRRELGVRAFEMILAHLHGEKKPQEVTLATEMVIRQSCDGLSPAVKRVQMMKLAPSESDDAGDLVALRETIQQDLLQSLENLPATARPWIKEQSIRLLDAFYDDVVLGSSGDFLKVLDIILRQSIAFSEDLNALHDVLSVIRFQLLLHCADDGAIAQQLETLWQQARILLSDVAQQAQVRRRLQATLQTRLLFEINEEVITTFDLPKLMDALTDALDQLGISFCYLCLNDDLEATTGLEKLPPWSRLILAYIDGEQRDLELGGVRFPTEQFLPEGILPDNRRYDMLILSLRFQDHYLGHAIFEMGARDGFIYDALQIQISSAVWGASLIQQLSQARSDLECRVEERTAELQNEIAERVKAEEAIRANEQRYRALFEQTNDAIFLADFEGNYMLVNQQTADLLGYTIEELIGTHFSKYVAPGDLSDGQAKFQALVAGETLPIYERVMRHKDGHLIPTEMNIALVRDPSGKPLHIQSVVRDISKRKRTERILHTLNMASLAMRQAMTPEEIFEALGNELRAMDFGCTIFRTNHDLSQMYPKYLNYEGKVVSMVEKLLNVRAEKFDISIEDVEMIQRAIWERETVFSNTSESIYQIFPKHLKSVAKQIVRLLNAPCSIHAPLVVDKQMMGMLSVQSNDLTMDDIPAVTAFAHQVAASWQKARLMQDLEASLLEQKRVEESLRENEEKYRTLFELSPEAIILIALNGIILDANQAAVDLGGPRKQDVIGKSFLELGLLEEDQLQSYTELFSQIVSGEIAGSMELKIIVQEDDHRWTEAHPALLKKGDDVLAVQLILHDITDRKNAERAIQQRVNELEAIYQTSIKLTNASLRVDEVAKIAVQQLGSAMNVDGCSFSLLGEDERILNVIADMWIENEKQAFLDQEETISLADYPAVEKVLKIMTPVVIQASDPEADSAALAYMQKSGKVTLAIIPLIVKSHAIGVMGLSTIEERIYTSNQLNLAMTLANQVAVALDNARLFEAAQKELLERIQTEMALQESEEQFRSIFENAVMGLYRSTPKGKIVMANPALVRMLGYSTFDELAERDLEVNGYTDDHPRNEFTAQIERDGQVVGVETAWTRQDGSVLYVQENARAIYDKAGRIVYYEGTVEDISERKKVEQERQALIEFQQIVARLSARFINLSMLEIEDEIKQALQIIAEYAHADACSVWMFSDDKLTTSKAFGWPTHKKEETNQDISTSRFSGLFGKLLNRESVAVSSKRDVHPEAEDMHLLLDNFNMTAILAVPLVSEGHVIGSLSIYMMRKTKKVWADDLEPLLKIIGDIIVNALERKRAEENIRQLNEELELRVVQRTQQLEAANKELEAFAYSVSHDLRAPLRAIDGFSLALIEDYGDQLDGGAENYLNRVRAASQRMGRLIDDLLKLSRVTRSEMIYHEVDLSKLVRETAAELQEMEPARNVTFMIQPDLEVLGDEYLLRIMLMNLCSNAWKFTSKKEQAHIKFGYLDGENPPVFFIRDNGAGFDMTYDDKLFGTFQRLHTTSDFEGTGIGLATVKRIVMRHGGRIWAESEVDRGATFYFTIGETP